MTKEDAAKILEHPVYKWSLDWDDREDGLEYSEAIQIAITALRAQQTPAKLDRSRWEGCEWCCDEVLFDDEDMELELLHPLEDAPRMVYPRYCPMCGRSLTEEARAELERRIE